MDKTGVNGIDLHYLDTGRGMPLVLIHGAGATDYRTWTPVIDRLAEQYRLVVPSLRYHYPNEWVGDGLDYTVATHVRDVATLIRALDIAPAHVAGSSAGANIALELARDHPSLVRSLILAEPDLSPWLPETDPADDSGPDAGAVEIVYEAAVQGDYEKAIRLFADLVFFPGAYDRLPEATRQRMLDNARLLSLPVTIRHEQVITFTREDAASIHRPTLLLRGDASPRPFLLAEEELAKHIPGAERVLIPNAAHVLHSMNPQAFGDAVLGFLARY